MRIRELILLLLSIFLISSASAATEYLTSANCGKALTSGNTYILSEDMDCSSNPGWTAFTIHGTGVVLECNNYRVILDPTYTNAISLREDVGVSTPDNIEIRNCQFEGNGATYGIEDNVDSNDIRIIGNTFTGFTDNALDLEYTSNALIDGNTFNDVIAILIDRDNADFASSNSFITNNNFNGKSLSVTLNTGTVQYNTFQGSDGISVSGNGNTIADNTFNSATNGITAIGNDLIIQNNNINADPTSTNFIGLRVSGSNILIDNNEVIGGLTGVYIFNSDSLTAQNNYLRTGNDFDVENGGCTNCVGINNYCNTASDWLDNGAPGDAIGGCATYDFYCGNGECDNSGENYEYWKTCFDECCTQDGQCSEDSEEIADCCSGQAYNVDTSECSSGYKCGQEAYCGDGNCDPDEDVNNCPDDCGNGCFRDGKGCASAEWECCCGFVYGSQCDPAPMCIPCGINCGDGICDEESGEDTLNCPEDCMIYECTLGETSDCGGPTACELGTQTCIENELGYVWGECVGAVLPDPIYTQVVSGKVLLAAIDFVNDVAFDDDEGVALSAPTSDLWFFSDPSGTTALAVQQLIDWAIMGGFLLPGTADGMLLDFAMGPGGIAIDCAIALPEDFAPSPDGAPGMMPVMGPYPICVRSSSNIDDKWEIRPTALGEGGSSLTVDIYTFTPGSCGPTCTDEDGDGLNAEGGDCGPIDQCPTTAGSEAYNGCPSGIKVFAVKHTIEETTKKPRSVKYPLSGLFVAAYDKSDESCAASYGISWHNYPDINENCEPAGGCITGSDGICIIGLEPGDYLIIGRHLTIDGSTFIIDDKHLGVSASDLLLGELKQKHLQLLEVPDLNGGGKKKLPGNKKEVKGSYLEIIQPDYVIWSGTEELYPFIFISDSDWTVDVCLEVPEGYEPIEGCLETFVAGETKVLQFRVVEVGSIPDDTDVTMDICQGKLNKNGKCIGKSHKINSKIGSDMTPALEKSKAAERASDKAKEKSKSSILSGNVILSGSGIAFLVLELLAIIGIGFLILMVRKIKTKTK
ncbi:right-handed parallel beta-helix repeat-containing protein [Nanoarchaeota archaeon]